MTNIDAIPLSWAAVVSVLIMSVAIPYVNAFLTNEDAPDWLTGPLSAVLAALGAVGAYLVDVKGITDWKRAATLAAAAAVGAAGFRKTLEPGVEPALKAGGPQIGKPKPVEPPVVVEAEPALATPPTVGAQPAPAPPVSTLPTTPTNGGQIAEPPSATVASEVVAAPTDERGKPPGQGRRR